MPTATGGSLYYKDWFVYEFWRFVFVQQVVGKLAQTALDYPPMQKGASFNLEQLKQELDKKIAAHGRGSQTRNPAGGRHGRPLLPLPEPRVPHLPWAGMCVRHGPCTTTSLTCVSAKV